MRNKILVASLAAIGVLVGCGKQAEQTITQTEKQVSTAPPAPPPKPPYTNEDWKRDFTSTFVASDQKTNGDGITKYGACFESSNGKCISYFSGMKDGFRKVDHLTPPITAFQEMGIKYGKNDGNAYIDMRVVARHCDEAVLVLSPTLYARTWLFMEKVAFMADGDVVYEQTAPSQSVDRDTDDGNIWEKWVFKLEPADYAKLEKFAEAKSKVIRVSGKKGYSTLAKSSVDAFAKDITKTIKTTQLINEALTKGGGPICAPA